MRCFVIYPAALAAALAVAQTVAGVAEAFPAGRSSPPPSAADALLRTGDFAAAALAYARRLRSKPHDPDANLGTAQLELYTDDLRGALAHARAALAADPSNSAAALLIAQIAKRMNGVADGYRFSLDHGEIDVPFVATDPLPTIRATIDGHAARLILDTGAPGLDLSAAFAAKAGVRAPAPRTGTFAGGRTETTRTGGRIDTLVIGSLTVSEIPAGIAPVPDPSIDGVVGTNFLYRFLATLDYANGRLILRPKSASAAFERAAAAAGDTIVPLYLVPDHFLFARARVNAGPAGLFNIDTGGAMIGIDLTHASLAAARIVPDAAHRVLLMGGGGPVQALPFTANTVSVGGTTVRDVPGIYIAQGNPYRMFPFTVAGRISHEFFRHSALTFDFSAMKLVLSP